MARYIVLFFICIAISVSGCGNNEAPVDNSSVKRSGEMPSATQQNPNSEAAEKSEDKVAGKKEDVPLYEGKTQDEWITQLKSEKDDERKAAVAVLGKIKTNASAMALVKRLGDIDESICYAAAKALGNIKDKKSMSKLINILENECKWLTELDGEVESNVRYRISVVAYALGKIGDSAAIPVLVRLLSHVDSSCRKAAANALQTIGDKAAVPGLLKALSDKDKRVRFDVACALAVLEHEKGFDTLIEFLNDKEDAIRYFAASALIDLGRNEGIPEIIKFMRSGQSTISGKYIEDGDIYVDSVMLVEYWEELNAISRMSAIPVLIDFLKGDKYDGAIIKVLKRLSGVDFGDDPAKWQEWWKTNKDRLLKEEEEKGKAEKNS